MKVNEKPKAKKRATSIFAPGRKGTDERGVSSVCGPEFLEVKDVPAFGAG